MTSRKILCGVLIILCSALVSCSTSQPETIVLYKQFQPKPSPVLDLPEIEQPDFPAIPNARFLNDPKTQEFVDEMNDRGKSLIVISQDYHTRLKKFHTSYFRYIQEVRARNQTVSSYHMSVSEWERQLYEDDLHVACMPAGEPGEDCNQ